MISAPRRGTPVGRGYHPPDGTSTLAAPRGPARGRGARASARRAGARRRARGAAGRADPRVREAIGVPELYTHQRDAWDAAARGEHLVVTTGTASGKTLAFNLPVLDALARDAEASRALYLYPTKALAQDQFRTLETALRHVPEAGDLRRRHADRAAPADPQVVERDPHEPGHGPHRPAAAPRPLGRRAREPRATSSSTRRTSTAACSARTSANVLRRLRRLARIYGAEPQFLLASATISNPGELGGELLGAPVTVDRRRRRAARRAHRRPLEPAAPRRGARAARLGARRGGEAPGRASSSAACARSRSRRAARPPSSIHRFTAERLGDDSQLSPYRAGYTAAAAARDRAASCRRRAARRLVDRRARARNRRRPARRRHLASASRARSPRSASNGAAQAGAVTGSRSSSRPRTRSTSTSCASPRSCSGAGSRRRSSITRIRACSPATCARPRTRRRSTRRTPTILGPEALEAAAADPELKRTPHGFVWAGKDSPAARAPLRSADTESVHRRRQRAPARVLGLVERSRAYSTVHEGAVYLHLGESYPRGTSSTRRRCAPSSSRSTATGTRRRRRTRTRRSSARSARSGDSGSTSSSARSR